jgi:hypothetical protein
MCEVRVDFSLFGDRLDFAALSQAIGLTPTVTWRKGTPISGMHLHKEDGWRISTGHVKTLETLPVIQSVLARLAPVRPKLLHAYAAFNLQRQLSIVLYLPGHSPSFNLPVEVVKEIAALDCSVDVDLILLGGS